VSGTQRPLLRRGGLTGAVYVITRYIDKGDRIIALEKYDVTEQFDALKDGEGS